MYWPKDVRGTTCPLGKKTVAARVLNNAPRPITAPAEAAELVFKNFLLEKEGGFGSLAFIVG
jgi:hypothetical protein